MQIIDAMPREIRATVIVRRAKEPQRLADLRTFAFFPRPYAGSSKCGLTSAPRLPQALQTNRGSMSANVVRPIVRRRRDRVTATVVGSKDQDADHAAGSHLAEGDFLSAHLP